MTTVNDNFKKVENIKIKNYIAEDILARMAAFQEKYAARVEKAAEALQMAKIEHSHYCNNGIYMSDGPDMEWTVEHPAAATLRSMFNAVNGKDPNPAKISYTDGRDDEETICVGPKTFLEDMKENADQLERHLREVSEKTDDKLTADDRKTLAGFTALKKLLDDKEFAKEYGELSQAIEDVVPQWENDIAAAHTHNKTLEGLLKNKRFSDLVEEAGGQPG